jgi:amidase
MTSADPTLCEQHNLLQEGTVTSVELVQASLERIALFDRSGPHLAAVAAVAPNAIERARQLDQERDLGQLRGSLHGLPLLVKDNYETADLPTTAGSMTLAQWRPKRDAELVRRLRAAGAIILAKTNMHEFAFGNRGFGSLFGQVRNPYNPTRVAGGSSSGTGAGIAAGYAAAGLGTDTCGSIGIPCAFNGIAGLRPTQGLTSRRGIIPLSSTQDIGGPMARSVADLALLLDVLAGTDEGDAQTAGADAKKPGHYGALPRQSGIRGVRIGRVVSRFYAEPKDDAIASTVEASLGELTRQGAEIVDVEVPNLAELIEDELEGGFVLVHDFPFDLDRYLAQSPDAPLRSFRELVDSALTHEGLKRNLALSSSVVTRDSPAYRLHIAKRAQLAEALVKTLEEQRLDVLGYPTVRCPAPLIGDALKGVNSHLGANSGLPVLTLPCGSLDGMPVGVDLLGRPWGEKELLRVGIAIERVWGLLPCTLN